MNMIFDRDELSNLMAKGGDTLADTGKNIKESTKTIMDTAPISLKLKEKENYLEKQYFELGVLYFQKHAGDEEPEYEQVDRIKEVQEEIRLLRDEIAEIKGKDVCEGCGEFVDRTSRFCPNCGREL